MEGWLNKFSQNDYSNECQVRIRTDVDCRASGMLPGNRTPPSTNRYWAFPYPLTCRGACPNAPRKRHSMWDIFYLADVDSATGAIATGGIGRIEVPSGWQKGRN